MNCTVRVLAASIAAMVLFLSQRAEAGTCKLSIMLDRSGSMVNIRQSDGRSRCEVATAGVTDAIGAFINGNDYVVNQGEVVSSTDVYDTTCPISDPNSVKLVSIWAYEDFGNRDLIHLTNGFVPALAAIGDLQNSGFYTTDPLHPHLLVPKACVPGGTPLAETMCQSAREFPSGLPAAGEARKALIFTDGEENASSGGPLGEVPCRTVGDPAQPDVNNPTSWGFKVINEYALRGISASGFLFDDGGAISAAVRQRASDAVAPVGGALTAAATRGYPASFDKLMFDRLAAATSGTSQVALDTARVAADSTLTDTDGDGIPDFRDLCDAPGCIDQDGDGIPDVIDQCLFSQEDGRGPNPGDGCPDTDADGIPDSRDACFTKREDYLPPKPTDGCPVPAAAAPAMSTGLALFLGMAMCGCGMVVLERKRRQTAQGIA